MLIYLTLNAKEGIGRFHPNLGRFFSKLLDGND